MALSIWFFANLLTGLAYVYIAFEHVRWSKGRNLHGFRYISIGYTAFVGLCGLHHLVMITMAGHHPTPWHMVAVDLAMAFTSIFVAFVLYHFRRRIRDIVVKFDGV